MREKPDQKPGDGEVVNFKAPVPHDGSGPAASQWAGTDLARFALDVVALNRQSVSARPDKPISHRCHVAPLESLQRGLKIQKKAAEQTEAPHPVTDMSRFRKE